MATRYAGDVEIRMRYEGGQYHVSFKAPGPRGGSRGNGKLSPRECRISREDRNSPEAYDKVAHRVIGFLRAKGIRTGEMRRVFQAPCPIPSGGRDDG